MLMKIQYDTTLIHNFAEKEVYLKQNRRTKSLKNRGDFRSENVTKNA